MRHYSASEVEGHYPIVLRISLYHSEQHAPFVSLSITVHVLQFYRQPVDSDGNLLQIDLKVGKIVGLIPFVSHCDRGFPGIPVELAKHP